jgi:hypothetical protein
MKPTRSHPIVHAAAPYGRQEACKMSELVAGGCAYNFDTAKPVPGSFVEDNLAVVVVAFRRDQILEHARFLLVIRRLIHRQCRSRS